FQRKRRILELSGNRVVGDGLIGNLYSLSDFGLDVVLRRDARRGQQAAVAASLEGRQRDVEIERTVDRSQRKADTTRRGCRTEIDRRRNCPRRRRRIRGSGTLDPAHSPAKAAVIWKREIRRIPKRRVDATHEAPLHTESPCKRLVRLNDSRFDLNLWL